MCGIAGIHLKQAHLQPRLGALLVPIIEALESRGPDSTGVAIYDRSVPATGQLRWSLRAPDGYDWNALAAVVEAESGSPARVEVRSNAALLVTSDEADLAGLIARTAPEVHVVGAGRAMTMFKDVGSARQICARYRLGEAGGYQGVGHTRMATESAITTQHSHPFSPAPDLALVHNGSFSNHASIRRRLADRGVRFETDNDSEVAAHYLHDQMSSGKSLSDSLRMVVKEFDGFFTLLVASQHEFAVVRDAFACKPLVVAETDAYVAVASEYQALADLPEITDADVYEPEPEEVLAWASP